MACTPPIQNYGSPNGLFCVGFWQCYPECHDWYWIGQRRTATGGWVGNPWSGYTLVPKPTQQCGTTPVPSPPPPPAPPAPPPASGQPTETPPPKPTTGPGADIPPPTSCGSTAMATVEDMQGRYGFSMQEHLKVPHVGRLVPLNLHAATQGTQGDDLVARTQPTFTKYPRIEYDDEGRLSVYHPGTGPGYVVFAPAELQDFHFWGSGVAPGSRWPTNISSSTLLLLSGTRQDASSGSVANQRLAFGLPHRTSQYPINGYVLEHDGTSGAPALYLRETDSNGALTTCTGTFFLRTKLDVLCNANFQGDVDIDGSLTVGGSPVGSEWTSVTANTIDATPATAVLLDDFSTIGAYTIIAEVVAYDQTNTLSIHQTFRHGFTQPDGNTLTSVGTMDEDLMDESGSTTTGVSFTSDGIDTVTASFQGIETNTCWLLRYRIIFKGVC